MAGRYTAVSVYPSGDGWRVVGYRRGAVHPEGAFATVGEAVGWALSLPQRAHPVTVYSTPLADRIASGVAQKWGARS